MKILAIDIGTGTQDILFYDTEKEIENSIKLVLPSPHLYIAQEIKNIKNDIYFKGEIMGGGKLRDRIIEHMAKGYKVAMEPNCAKTIRDNLSQVESYGIEIDYTQDNKKYSNYTKLILGDISIKKIGLTIKNFDLDFKFDQLAIAVQDHGYSEKMGDRDFRFEKIREKINTPIKPEEFAFLGNVPNYYSRMKAVERSLKKESNITPLIMDTRFASIFGTSQIGKKMTPLIMDTKFASICGMCHDEFVSDLKSYIVIDIGNGHTTAASIEDGKIQGIFEHHTSSLTGQSLEKYIKKLASGNLTNKEVYNDHGHGAHVLNPIKNIEKVIISGPKRKLIEETNLDWHHASPGGDVMMTGTIGLVKSFEYLKSN